MDCDFLVWFAVIIDIVLVVGWFAAQFMGIVQGVRFHLNNNTLCNQDLSTFLIVSAVLSFAALLTCGVLYCLSEYDDNHASTPTPAWRKAFFGPEQHHLDLYLRRIPNATWHRDYIPLVKRAPHIKTGKPQPQQRQHQQLLLQQQQPQDQQSPLDDLLLIPDHKAISPPILPRHMGDFYGGWRPPRSTCIQTTHRSASMMRLGPFYSTRGDAPYDPPTDKQLHKENKLLQTKKNTSNMHLGAVSVHLRVGGENKISIFEARRRWRKVLRDAPWNGIYSTIPSSHYLDPSVGEAAFEVMWHAFWGMLVVTLLAGLGWLIYGTWQVSKSDGGGGLCEPALYKSALSLVIINWTVPILTAVITFFLFICAFSFAGS